MHCDRFALLSNLFFSEIVGKKKYLLYQLISKEQKMAIILFLGFLTSQDSVKENILKINDYFHMFLTIFVVYIILNSVNSWWIKPSLFLQSGFKFEWPQTVRKTMHPQKLLRNAPFFLSCPNSPIFQNVAYRPNAYKTGVCTIIRTLYQENGTDIYFSYFSLIRQAPFVCCL